MISNNFSTTNQFDASSQLISILSASTLLSSILHAIIATQKRINKSDDNIESVMKKEMQVILYHIQILKQDLNQSNIKAEVYIHITANKTLRPRINNSISSKKMCIVCSRSHYTSHRHFNRFISCLHTVPIKCTLSSAPLQRHVIFINCSKYDYIGSVCEKDKKKKSSKILYTVCIHLVFQGLNICTYIQKGHREERRT